MAGLSDYERNRIVDHYGGGSRIEKETSYRVHLTKTEVLKSQNGATIDKCDYEGYAYIEETNDNTLWSEPSDGECSNIKELFFPMATGGDNTPVGVALLDPSGTNVIMAGTIPESARKQIVAGDRPFYPIGDIKLKAL